MTRLTRYSLTVWLLIVVFEAPLRYLLAEAGQPQLIYIKDLILLALTGIVLITSIYTLRLSRTLLISLAVLVYGVLIGAWHGLPAPQVLFGLKIFLPFIVGLLIVRLAGLTPAHLVTAFRVITPVILLGLALDLWTDLPWTGLEYDFMGLSIEGSRAWSMSGLPRLAGFGRASYETASMLFCLASLYFIARSDLIRDRLAGINLMDTILLVMALAGIILTTFKTALFAFILLGVFWLACRRATGAGMLSLPARASFRTLSLALVGYAIIPPVAAAVVPRAAARFLQTDNAALDLLSASFAQRLERMWPAAFDVLTAPHQLLTGRGIGGIGTAQLYFEPTRYNAADNLFVYLTVSIGTLLTLAAALLVVRHIIVSPARSDLKTAAGAVLILIMFAFGATISVAESTSLALTAGLCIAILNRVPLATKEQSPTTSSGWFNNLESGVVATDKSHT
jgi:hypothetical protein